MANQEQLSLLKNGSQIWNKWRAEHKKEIINLTNAQLQGMNLRDAHLGGANLEGATLRGADLTYANLSKNAYEISSTGTRTTYTNLKGVDFREANLRNTDFRNANLNNANFSQVDLSTACLTKARLFNAILRETKLSYNDLSGSTLRGADLRGADLSGANLNEANLSRADLSGANLSGANLRGANLNEANLSRADLSRADLSGQNLNERNLSRMNLRGANLNGTSLIKTNFSQSDLTDCSIYGIAAWDVQLEGTLQTNLIITPPGQSVITVDNLKIAQFIYLMLNNKEIRDVINTLTTKSVLILGRFTPERKAVLDALREKLRDHNYLPILFDFEGPRDRNLTETVRTLAHLARFIIADITEPSSIPQELQAIIPTLAVSVQPILLEERRAYAMYQDFSRYHWVLPIYFYKDQVSLLASLGESVIQPAEQKAQELEKPGK